VVLLISTSV